MMFIMFIPKETEADSAGVRADTSAPPSLAVSAVLAGNHEG